MAFKCDECGLTWAEAHRTEDDICDQCAEEEDDEDGGAKSLADIRDGSSKHPWAYAWDKAYE